MQTLFLLLGTTIALASAPQEQKVATLFSLCGTYDAQHKALTLAEGEKLKLSGESLPPANGAFCVRGSKLKWNEGWEFSPVAAQPNDRPLKFPVMICGEMYGEELYTFWKDTMLHFTGPFPEGKKRAESKSWCADGKKLFVQREDGWTFNAEQFRAFSPGPNVANQ